MTSKHNPNIRNIIRRTDISLRFRNKLRKALVACITCISPGHCHIPLCSLLSFKATSKAKSEPIILSFATNKDLKQFLQKHQLQSLAVQLFCCVVASVVQKQDAYYRCKMGLIQGLYVQKRQLSPHSQSSPHTSLWHVDSIIVHTSL